MLALPPDLLRAVAERRRSVTLVVGAGCSLEEPTGLKLAHVYAEDAHSQLIRDRVLDDGDCANPADLSALATAVVTKTGRQEALVERLPIPRFRMAKPNAGHLIAAALLREGVIDAVLTLNFDLALSKALSDLSAIEVNIVAGPRTHNQTVSTAVVYLHRNVDEDDFERWILTVEALNNEWHDGWEEVVVRRLMACPVVIFAGLGSPAAVLTESVAKIRQALDPARHRLFVVDPSATTEFESALQLPEEDHLQAGWCEFMEQVSQRLLVELASEMSTAGNELCTQHGWRDETAHLQQLSEGLHAIGLVPLGKLRSRWLLEDEEYTPDSATQRPLLADLLLGVGLVERASGGATARFREDGVVEFVQDGSVRCRTLPASGRGSFRWSALEPLVLRAVAAFPQSSRPEYVLVSGVVGARPATVGPPEDVVVGELHDDIVSGFTKPTLVTVDEVRADPQAATQIVAA